jgi:hypothetical protein
MTLKLAVPTDLPCWLMIKLPDWATAAGARARNAASGIRTKLRMNLPLQSEFIDTKREKMLWEPGNSDSAPTPTAHLASQIHYFCVHAKLRRASILN